MIVVSLFTLINFVCVYSVPLYERALNRTGDRHSWTSFLGALGASPQTQRNARRFAAVLNALGSGEYAPANKAAVCNLTLRRL
jgi:hypothetical protein